MPSPCVSIIIVNYNSTHMLPACLDSIQAQTMESYEVIIIDNASTDGSMSRLDRYPEVQKIYNDKNLGFAAAQNLGFRIARGRYILALNFDLIMSPTHLEQLVRALEADPKAGWASGKLVNMDPDGTKRDTIYSAGHVLLHDRFPRLRGNNEKDLGQYDQTDYVFGAPGAAAIYKRELVEDISFDGQFFDESLFTWGEDVDVDWRAQTFGWKCLYVPAALAYHQGHVNEILIEPFRTFRTKLTIRNRWLILIANEKNPHYRDLIGYEFSLIIHILKKRHVLAYIKALYSFWKCLPVAMKKRRTMAGKAQPLDE